MTIIGRYVAFERFIFNNTFTGDTVAVYDVRRGVRVSEDPSGVQTDDRHLSDTGLGPVTDIVLRSNGHVAWMARSFGDSLVQTLQVWKRDQSGLTAVAEGPGLIRGSLAAATSTLYWLDVGTPTSAAFS